MLLARLAYLFGRHLNQVCPARAQIQPLIANRAMNMNLDRVRKRPAAPAILIGFKSPDAVHKSGELIGARTNPLLSSGTADGIGESDAIVVAGEQAWQVGHRRV